MSACTFFGHRDCPESVSQQLYETLDCLITEDEVDTFYVGNQGQFDFYAYTVLQKLKICHPHIRITVVLAYMPRAHEICGTQEDTILPEGIERVPPRFAISWRNQWMIRHCDYVVTYITHSWGGAAQFAQKAAAQHKKVINLSNNK